MVVAKPDGGHPRLSGSYRAWGNRGTPTGQAGSCSGSGGSKNLSVGEVCFGSGITFGQPKRDSVKPSDVSSGGSDALPAVFTVRVECC